MNGGLSPVGMMAAEGVALNRLASVRVTIQEGSLETIQKHNRPDDTRDCRPHRNKMLCQLY